MKKMVLIDGNSLLFRSYYATGYANPSNIMRTSTGVATNAIYGLASMLIKLVTTTDAKYGVVAFDTGKPTFRHQMYQEYKGTRKKVEDDLIAQMSLARELVKLFGFNIIEIDGFEADDVIGTVATIATKEGIDVEIYSGDRDLLQLVSDRVKVNLTIKGLSKLEVMDVAKVKEKYQLEPRQLIDLKGLMGDASDNIKGIAGVGEKTATSLLLQYGSLENILANAEQVKGKVKDKLIEGKESAITSKMLATIVKDIPLDYPLDYYLIKKINKSQLSSFFKLYEMSSLDNRLTNLFVDTQVTLNPTKDCQYQCVKVLPVFTSGVCIAPVYEGSSYYKSGLKGLVVGDLNGVYYIEKDDLLNDKQFISFLSSFVEKTFINYKIGAVLLGKENIEINNVVFDPHLSGALLNSVNLEFSDTLKSYHLNVSEEIVLKQVQYVSYSLKVEQDLKNKIVENNLTDLLNTEVALAKLLAKMELEGVSIDLDLLRQLDQFYLEKLNEIKDKIINLCGEFNIQSPAQLAEVLFDKLHLPQIKKRSTNIEVLERLIDYHPVIGYLIEHRKYAKLVSTYSSGLQNYIHQDGKLHATFNQTGTVTGRVSSTSPNLQQIAAKDEAQKNIRKIFVSSFKNGYLMSIDYSQIELRLLASIADEEVMKDIFNNDGDIHTLTASEIFNVEVADVDESLRKKAKAINFGILYGMSAWGLASSAKISPAEAKVYLKLYSSRYKKIEKYFTDVVDSATKTGKVKTMFGRIRRVEELADSSFIIKDHGRRIALNSPLQGSAADIIKMAMVAIDHFLSKNNYQSKIIMQIHDELVFDVAEEELDIMLNELPKIMENIVDVGVRLKVNVGYGKNLYEVK